MGEQHKLAVVFNPCSANGRTGRRWPKFDAALRAGLGDFTLLRTEQPEHAVTLVRDALEQGHDRIVSVGGDGTHWEVVNGFFKGNLPINPRAAMGIVSHGTGSDLARTLSMPRGLKALPWLAEWKSVPVDLGRVTYTLNGGGLGSGYFLNSAHIGMGGTVVHRVNRTTKRCGGFVSYLWGTLVTLMTFRNPPVQIEIDGNQIDQVCRDIVVAKGQYDGGGMHMAPKAQLNNGHFEVYVIGDITRTDALLHLPLLYRGQLEKRPDKIRHFRATRVTARSPQQVLITLDGEQPGRLPAAIEMVPTALNLVVGPHCTAIVPSHAGPREDALPAAEEGTPSQVLDGDTWEIEDHLC